VKQGFQGPIFCTPATAELAKLLLLDSARIQEQDAYFWNKRHPSQAIQPAYEEKDIEAVERLFRPQGMALAFEALPGVRTHFHEAGHILGSAQISLRWTEGGTEKDCFFSGDLGPRSTPLLKDPFRPQRAPQTLLLESTYGDREHGEGGPLEEGLRAALAPVLEQGGKVLIPSFAVGRTQELLYQLAGLFKDKRLPQVTVYVDSPLAEATTHLFSQHRELMDGDFHAHWRGQDPFGQSFVRYTSSKEESQAINGHRGPCIILSASGMCEAGRVLHHLEQLAPDPKNLILFVGFQAEGTLGRRLKEGAKVARLFGQEVPVESKVLSLEGFSAHAGRGELLSYVRELSGRPGVIHLVHGETSASSSLAAALRQEGYNVDVATLGREITL
jgi:metallo-beta-lactamase family protein